MPGTEVFGPEEKKEVNDVLESGILFRYNYENDRNGHWKAQSFEEELAKFNGVRYAHSCTSGTTAVSIAMACSGLGHGHEVIVPPFTYIATIEGVLNAGAIPVFAEIDETLCLSPEGIEAAITPNTKAVVLVHMCGAMARLDEIIEVCERNNLILIEDSAQALGATYNGKAIGTFGKIGSFSFDFFKIITCGEGGAVITDDKDYWEKAHQYSDHGHDHIGTNRGAEQHPILGTNYRISELNAAVGLAQVRKLGTILEKQRANKKVFEEVLGSVDGVQFRDIPDNEGDSATFFSFFLPTEEQTRAAMKGFADKGIAGTQYWYDNNFHYIKNWQHLKDMNVIAPVAVMEHGMPQDLHKLQLPKSDDVISRLISVQIKVGLSTDETREYLQGIKAVLQSIL